MREAVFINQNLDKWKQYEASIENASSVSPDELADIYTDLTTDLSFAQTHYPNSKVTEYLNGLALTIHNEIYSKRYSSREKIKKYWLHDIPLALYDARKEMRISLAVFSLFVLVGVVSTLINVDFARLILGDGYVDMTIENIKAGKPTDVYSGDPETLAFLEITLNNLMVDIKAFTWGIFTSIGTGLYMIANGVMLGVFLTFFAVYGVFGPSFLAVMQHGTIEISTMVIAGCAGIVMGNGWLFPGTYSRIESFKRSAKRGLKVLVSSMPLTVIAGFIEGFITRHTEAPLSLRIGVLVVSALLIIWLYVVMPVKVHREEMRQSKFKENEKNAII